MLNPADSIRKSSNKLEAFKTLDGIVPIPEYTDSWAIAYRWKQGGYTVVVRNVLSGHSGAGIEIISPDSEDHIPLAPLYTKYARKTQEYRVHVFNGEVFFVQRKARKMEVPDENVNWQIRNLNGGFIYANQDVEVSEDIRNASVRAVQALGLDFGAVDVLTHGIDGYRVLEVNTAPGLTGTTLEKYAEQISNYVRSLE